MIEKINHKLTPKNDPQKMCRMLLYTTYNHWLSCQNIGSAEICDYLKILWYFYPIISIINLIIYVHSHPRGHACLHVALFESRTANDQSEMNKCNDD